MSHSPSNHLLFFLIFLFGFLLFRLLVCLIALFLVALRPQCDRGSAGLSRGNGAAASGVGENPVAVVTGCSMHFKPFRR